MSKGKTTNYRLETGNVLRSVIELGICTGCGTCAGICTHQAITMKKMPSGLHHPELNTTLCNDCKRCEAVCPALAFNPQSFNYLFPRCAVWNPLLGCHIAAYIGHATDQNTRLLGTSGGIVTALLMHALDVGKIDGAAVVRWSGSDPFSPEALLVHSKQQIQEAAGSKYLPVPLNIVLSKSRKKELKYALVGLPCHIRGLRKAQSQDKKLHRQFPIVIGLVCSHAIRKDGFEFVLRSAGVDTRDVVGLSTANSGWPGGLRVCLNDGTSRFIPRLRSIWSDMFGSGIYTPGYCFYCSDMSAELADVSTADAWIPNIVESDRIGMSIVLARTSEGRRLLTGACSLGAVTLRPCSIRSFVRAQASALVHKKRHLMGIRNLMLLFGKNWPMDRTPLLRPHLLDYPAVIYAIFVNYFGNLFSKRQVRIPLSPPLVRMTRFIHKCCIYFLARGIDDGIPDRKILFINQHGDNRGDQAALHGLLSKIHEMLPQYDLTVHAQTSGTEILRGFRVPVTLHGMMASYKEGIVALCYLVLRSLGMKPTFLLRCKGGEKIRDYEEADLVVSDPGGPYLGDIYSGHEHAHLFAIWFAQTLGKSTVLCAPSCGPFAIRWRNPFRRYILKRLTRISVRESISKQHLITLGISSDRIHVTPDAALQYPVKPFRGDLQNLLGVQRALKEMKIGFTPCEWSYPAHKDPEEKVCAYVDSMAKALDNCIEMLEADIIAYPQLFGSATDLPFIERILSHMRNSNNLFIFPPDLDCTEQQSVIGRMDLMIATRYHSQIFASKMLVPSVCISYEHKARGFMKLLDLENCVMDIEDVSEEKVWSLIKSVWKRREEIRYTLKRVMPVIVEHSQKSSSLCVDILRSHPGM